MEYGSWPNGKIKEKELGKRKIAGWKKYLLQVDRRSRGTEVGRPFTGGYLFQVGAPSSGELPFSGEGSREYLLQVGYLFHAGGRG